MTMALAVANRVMPACQRPFTSDVPVGCWTSIAMPKPQPELVTVVPAAVRSWPATRMVFWQLSLRITPPCRSRLPSSV